MRTMTTPSSRGGGPPFPGSLDAAGLNGIISHAGIARSLRFLALNFHRPIRVSDLRRRAGLSPRGFIKAFKRHTGFRPGQLLIRLRIDLAKRLLAEQRLSVAELAEACGFRRMNSFVVTFRREIGVAPMQYQRERERRLDLLLSQPPAGPLGSRRIRAGKTARGGDGRGILAKVF